MTDAQPTRERLHLRLAHARIDMDTRILQEEVEGHPESPWESRAFSHLTQAQLDEIAEYEKSHKIDELLAAQDWALNVAAQSRQRSTAVKAQPLKKIDRSAP